MDKALDLVGLPFVYMNVAVGESFQAQHVQAHCQWAQSQGHTSFTQITDPEPAGVAGVGRLLPEDSHLHSLALSTPWLLLESAWH